MRKPLIILLSFLLITFNSCQNETVESAQQLSIDKDFKLIEVDGRYEIKVLNYLEASNSLNSEASLQQMHATKEEYIIVIDEPKDEFISVYQELNEYDSTLPAVVNYRDLQLNFITEVMDPIRKTKPKSYSINQLSVEYIEMDAFLEHTDDVASYFIYYIESATRIYTVMAWTLEKNKEVYREKVKKMMQTFNDKTIG